MASTARKLTDNSPKKPRMLSTRELLEFLDVDGDLPTFIEVHAGNRENIDALFSHIEELKTKSPADYERLMDVAKSTIENPDDLIPALGREIYPPVKTGIRGKDPAAPSAVEERVPTDTDTTALAAVPAPKEPAVPAAPAAKRPRGRPRKTVAPPLADTATVEPEAAAPTPEPAPAPAAIGPTDPASFVAKASNPEVAQFDINRADPTFRMDATPGAFAAADPYGVGLEAMMAGKFGDPAAGIDNSMFGSTPMRDVMPPVPDTPIMSQPAQRMSPSRMSVDDEINALASLLYEGGDTPPGMSSPGFGQDDVDIPEFSDVQQTNLPPGIFGQDNADIVELSDPKMQNPWTSTIGMQSEKYGGRTPPPKDVPASGPWQPANSMASQFFKAMGLPGGERFMTVATSPIDSSLDFMANHPKLTAAGLVGAGLGMSRLNQAPPNPNAVAQEQVDQDALELRAARQRLAEQSRRGKPAVIPDR